MLCLGEVVNLAAIKMETFRSFFEMHHHRKAVIGRDNINFSAKNFKFAKQIKLNSTHKFIMSRRS